MAGGSTKATIAALRDDLSTTQIAIAIDGAQQRAGDAAPEATMTYVEPDFEIEHS